MIKILLMTAAFILPAKADDGVEKSARIKQLATLLESYSDVEYADVLKDHPEAARHPALGSRAKALGTVYKTMAGLQYHAAATDGPTQVGRSLDSDYDRVAGKDAAAVAVDARNMEETGLGKTLLKMLGKAAINYVRFGIPIPVGRSTGGDSKAADLADKVTLLEDQLAAAEDGSQAKADLHYQVGRAYEDLAETTGEPESEEARAGKKKARIRQLAMLLEAFSDDEYQEALGMTAKKTAGRPELASKGTVLVSAYTTLAAMEYHEAAKLAPTESGRTYSEAYDRVVKDDAGKVGVNPETLEETGWFTNILALGALGGAGYLAYENQRIKKRGDHERTPPQAPGAVDSLPAECPPNTTLQDGKCLGEAVCPDGNAPADGKCFGETVCPDGTPPADGKCAAGCPPGSEWQGGKCVGTVVCPRGSKYHESAGGPTCLVVDPVECPQGSEFREGRCIGTKVGCGKGQLLLNGKCQARGECPVGMVQVGEECKFVKYACPRGSRLSNDICYKPMTNNLSGGTAVSGRCPSGMDPVKIQQWFYCNPRPPYVVCSRQPSQPWRCETDKELKAAEPKCAGPWFNHSNIMMKESKCHQAHWAKPVADLHQNVDLLQKEYLVQVGRGIDTTKRAETHYKLGDAYEQLAAAASPKEEARPAAPTPEERRVEKRVRKQRKKPAKIRPSRREQDERDMKDLEDMGADMSREINRRREERKERQSGAGD